jgi:hypothetical protein
MVMSIPRYIRRSISKNIFSNCLGDYHPSILMPLSLISIPLVLRVLFLNPILRDKLKLLLR